MPLPTLVFMAFGVGMAAALLGGSELRLSPRHAMLTCSFKAYALFLLLIVLPVSVYFYVFHGDWFLLYSVDVRRIPSAVALLGFVAEARSACSASRWARASRATSGSGWATASWGWPRGSALAVVALWPDRLLVVGTFAQYRGDFGLRTYGGELMEAGLAMGLLLAYGAMFLLVRIRMACSARERRAAVRRKGPN